MTIGYLHVGVISLTTRILWYPDYIKRSTDLGRVQARRWSFTVWIRECASRMLHVRGTLNVNCILSRAESEKPNKSTLENWDELGIKEKSFDSDENDSLLSPGLHYRSSVVSNFGKLHLNSHFSWPLCNTPAIQNHRTSSRSCYTAGFTLATRCGILNTPQTFPSLTLI